ncbi:MAG: VWA domain-containing protein, partial [Myxococcota bacterium]
MIEFGAPWVFWALGPVYVLWVGLWLFAQFKKRDGAVRFSSLNELFLPAAHGFVFLRLLTRALRVAALGLLLFALARPQLRAEEAPIYSEGIDIMLALDTSASMNAVDLDADKPIRGRRTRLEVVKDVVREFVARRPADQVGMVVFGTWAYTQCPLTLDHAILNNFLVNLQIGIAGRSTAIGDAIGIGVKRLRKSEAKSRVMILLTDGENNSGKLDPQKAAEIAKTFGIRIYTIGAGTRGDAPVIDQGILGPRVGRMRTSID